MREEMQASSLHFFTSFELIHWLKVLLFIFRLLIIPKLLGLHVNVKFKPLYSTVISS